MSPEGPPPPPIASPPDAGPGWSFVLRPIPLLSAALVTGWLGVALAYRGDDLGWVFAALTFGLAVAAIWRVESIRRSQRAELLRAVKAAQMRHQELDLLRTFAGAMLAVRTREELFREVAVVAQTLLRAEGGGLLLLVEEGRFVKVVGATGCLAPISEALLPVDDSLSGWVIGRDQAVVSNALVDDSRLHPLPELGDALRAGVVCPLRSSGLVLGVVSAYNRPDAPFGDDDVRLLQTLADQAAFGLDRVSALEESRRNEEALLAKNRELERATKLKSMFLANMSHELRTPLNAIIGFSDLLLTGDMGPLDAQQQEFLESISRNGTHLLGLINNVLDLSKIEAGRMSQTLTSVDLRSVITSVVADTASLRGAKRQRMAIDVDGAPPVITGDGQRIRQVLLNLLSNAAKFSPEEGEITLRAVATRATLPLPADRATDGSAQPTATREAVWVAVADTGIGIDPADHDKLFVAFSQVDSSASRRQQGTGLGLALCKQFVEMHGGTIGVESIPGHGSTFWFLLPVDGPIRRTSVQPPDSLV